MEPQSLSAAVAQAPSPSSADDGLGAALLQKTGGARQVKERIIEWGLLLAGLSSIIITLGIVAVLLYESAPFFRHVSVVEFLTDTEWNPLEPEEELGEPSGTDPVAPGEPDADAPAADAPAAASAAAVTVAAPTASDEAAAAPTEPETGEVNAPAKAAAKASAGKSASAAGGTGGAQSEARWGILPLLSGTLLTTCVALLVAIPVGTVSAIWLSEYAPASLREIIKPALELLGAVPTVVYGYFAVLFVTPLLQSFMPDLPKFNALSAGLVMGIMIIPYVSSLSEDAMHAVPMHMREGSYAMGATRMQTALRVIFPAAFSGITAAYILGISRAVGETMVVALAAGLQSNLTFDPTEPAMTITAYIVQTCGGETPRGTVAYQSIFAAGLTLLVLTLLFNIGGYLLRKRYREAY